MDQTDGEIVERPVETPRRWYRRKRFSIPCLIVLVLCIWLAVDFYGPATVPLEPDHVWDLPCLRADDLVIQGSDADGHVWATRGMWAYRLEKQSRQFVRQYHVPTGLSVYWLLNFSFVREFLHKTECVEILPLADGAVCAMSGGVVWHRTAGSDTFEKTFVLRYYGRGIGRGIFPPGLTVLKDGTIVFGEYFRNHERTDVRLYASADGGKTWRVAHEFPAGRIRHIHAVQQDPYTDRAWVCTGDVDPEPMIAWTADVGKTLNPIGGGSQEWRTCQLAFASDAIYWGADTGRAGSTGIYRWDRKTRQLAKLAGVPGYIMFAATLGDETIVLSSDREGAKIEQDDVTRLWVVVDGRLVGSIPFGRWASRKAFGYLRFGRTHGSDALYITRRNVTDHNGDLVVVSSADLRQAARRTGNASVATSRSAPE